MNDSNNSSNAVLSATTIIDAEKYVKPFDVSTNLLYYKNSSNSNNVEISEDDEAIIINARKMYNKIDDEEPIGGSIDVNISELYNKDIILTSYISINSEGECDSLTEIYPYVNKETYDYTFSDKLYVSDDQFLSSYQRVRYTDMRSKSPQWSLFKLTGKNVVFNTTDDFSVNVSPKADASLFADIIMSDEDTFEIPCKMTVKFENLIFKQKIRKGIEFDDISNVEYENRIFPIDEFKNSASGFYFISGSNQISNGNGSYLPSGNYYEYDAGVKIISSEYSLGGSEYKHDMTTATTIANSVKKWATEHIDNKYSDLVVFSDYNPQTSPYNCIGTPYFNMDKILNMRIYDENGTDYFLEKAEMVKIATDVKNISNLSLPDEYESYEDYPTSMSAIINNGSSIGTISGLMDDDSYFININVNLSKVNVNDKGLYKFNVEGLGSFISSGKDINQFGIYFNGLLYNKEVYIVDDSQIYKFNETYYKIAGILENTVILNQNGTVNGNIKVQFCEAEDAEEQTIELHNVKPKSPIITSLNFSFNDTSNIDNNKLFVNNEKWKKYVIINSFNNITYKLDPYFAFQSAYELKSEITEDHDEDGNVKGLFIKLKVPGIKQFDEAKLKFYFDNSTQVVLSTQELVDSYDNMISKIDLEDYSLDTDSRLEDIKEECFGSREEHGINDIVTSGELRNEYNAIRTSPIDYQMTIGTYGYEYNPQGNDEFQLEVITKKSGETEFDKSIYYVNLPTEKWYNLSLYNYTKTNQKGNDHVSKIGLQLTDVNEENLEDLSETPKEIFRCFVSNDKIIEGNDVYTTIPETFPDVISSGMYKLNENSTTVFDSCSRNEWNLMYTSDTKYLAYSDENIDDEEYESRKNRDLFSITDSSFDGLNFNSGKNAKIELFANDTLLSAMNSNTGCKIVSRSNEMNNSHLSNKDGDVKSFIDNVFKYGIPRKIDVKDCLDYSVLASKDLSYHINSIEGMKCKSIMWISSPNFKDYVMSNAEALEKVNDYIDYFGNPQHKLPPVKYDYKILNSDYATMVYNNCEKTTALNISTIDKDTLSYDYSKCPLHIAYVWDNSQVSRNESIISGVQADCKFYWTKSSSDEYIAEVGSIYNYQDGQNTQNIYRIETGSITQRQTTLMPVTSSPLSFEKKSDENGIISVNDSIIATAALGYNSNGYPKNGIMVYNSNESVSIDTTQTTYLYVSQNDQTSDCVFGSTEEKPVYVDTIQQNIEAYAERYSFIPNPEISQGKTGEDADVKLTVYYNEGLEKNLATNYMKTLISIGSYNEISNSQLSSLTNSTSYNLSYINKTLSSTIFRATLGKFENYTQYNYDQDEIYYINSRSNSNSPLYATFIGNTFAFRSLGNQVVDSEVFNVFYDESMMNSLIENSNGIDITTEWETLKCFYFDGKLVPSTLLSGKAIQLMNHDDAGIADAEEIEQLEEQINNAIKLNSFGIEGFEANPTMAIIWLTDNKPQSWKKFNSDIQKDIYTDSYNAIFDQYFSVNLTGVKLKINSEHISNAPTKIKISLLKAYKGANDTVEFKWINDTLLDIDVSDETDVYNYENTDEIEIEKQFVLTTSTLDLTKHVFGIKFMIEEIVPQQNEYNSCIIDNIKIFASNIFNEFGQSMSVEDTYVRKADANCRNHYNMKVNEYVWQIPDGYDEWKSLENILSTDISENTQEYIDMSAWKLISGDLSDLGDVSNNTTVSSKFTGSKNKDTSYLDMYYITTDSKSKENNITTIISDNYVSENENISITWKYIDYVYVYYSCSNGLNANYLLEKYFGNNIFNAVKAKLNENISNLNVNSGLSDRYTFAGGIAIEKSDQRKETTNTTSFDWKSSVESTLNYMPVYTSYSVDGTANYTQVKTYYKNVNSKKYVIGKTNVASSSEEHINDIVKRENILTSIDKNTNIVVENAKYSSTDNWVNSFLPIQIHYRIE